MAIEKITEATLCCGCGACVASCPKQAISLQPNEKGFVYPVIAPENCISCGLCQSVCPVNHASPVKTESEAYAARRKDTAEVLGSTSGGVFSALAESCLNAGGAVFGVSMDADMVVRHHCAETVEQMQAFKGSKYVQSELGDTYSQAEKLLKNGRTVLFSGTPCQINGLKGYLRTEYPNLLTVDVVCHGVPSPLLFKQYLALRQKDFRYPIKTFRFRDKEYGWSRFAVVLSDGETESRTVAQENWYFYGFLHSLYLRESCHHCVCKGENARADITLADYWSCEGKLVDDKIENGLSLVFTHTDAGRAAFAEILPKLETEKRTVENVLRVQNKAYYESAILGENSERFWQRYRKHGINSAMKKYCRDTYPLQFYYWLRRTARKILK